MEKKKLLSFLGATKKQACLVDVQIPRKRQSCGHWLMSILIEITNVGIKTTICFYLIFLYILLFFIEINFFNRVA